MRVLKTRRSSRGISLVEVLTCMLVLMIVGIGTILSIVYTRQSMELDKQRLAALNYCRQEMEAATAHATISSGSKVLVPFNTPGVEDLESTLFISYYPIGASGGKTGQIDWDTQLGSAPGNGQPVVCHVKVVWNPPGTWSRQQKVTMTTIVRAGTV